MKAKVVGWAERQPVRRVVTMEFALVLFLALLLCLTACGSSVGGDDREATRTPTGGLDDPGTRACNEFARWLAGDEDPATRPAIARQVDKLASTSKSGELSAKSETLARSTVVSSDENWALAADAFAFECQRLGWTADDAR